MCQIAVFSLRPFFNMKKTIYSALALLTFASAALSQSVVQPGDPVIASSANSPGSEGVANAIDGKPTKYLNFDGNASKNIEERIYIMRINCLSNEFKDISVNGKKILNAKWVEPNGDKLINDVISDSCENV